MIATREDGSAENNEPVTIWICEVLCHDLTQLDSDDRDVLNNKGWDHHLPKERFNSDWVERYKGRMWIKHDQDNSVIFSTSGVVALI